MSINVPHKVDGGYSYSEWDVERLLHDSIAGDAKAIGIDDLITGDTGQWCINIRGTNGSGKTTLARKFVETDTKTKVFLVNGLRKTAFTFCPRHNVVLIGGYREGMCGGCDTLVKEQIVKLMQLAWMSSANIIFEGVLVSDSKEPYYHLMKVFSDQIAQRIWGFAYLETSIDECLNRIYTRNGGKDFKAELVAQKYKNSIRYRKWHEAQGDCVVIRLNGEKPTWDVFMGLLTGIDQAKQGIKHILV